MYGRIYRVSFAAVAVTAAQDLFEVTSASGKILAIHKCVVGQYSDFGDAQDELLSVQIITGYTTSGSGGNSFTALTRPGDAACSATCEINNTTVANTGTAAVRVADAFNVRAGWLYEPAPEDRVLVASAERVVVRITAPADSLTMSGYLVFEEIG